MIRSLGGLAVFALVLSNSSVAEAHLRLTSHESRYGGNVLKSCPCGQGGGQRTTDKVYWAKPGTQVQLEWDEYVNHPGHFRIAFDADGVDDLLDPHINDPICADRNTATPEACFQKDNTSLGWVDNIPDHAAGTANENLYSFLYTFPDVTCDNCTLQVIQVMYDKPPYLNSGTDPAGNAGNDLYYQCIDVILDPNGPDTLQLYPGAPPPQNPTANGDSCAYTPPEGSGPTGPVDQTNPTGPTDQTGSPVGSQSGCSASSAAGFGSGLLILLAGLALRRRRQNS